MDPARGCQSCRNKTGHRKPSHVTERTRYTGITPISGGELFRWAFDVAVAIPGPSVYGFADTLDVATGASTDRVRSEIAAAVRQRVSELVPATGPNVPPDRVAVTLP